MGVVVGWGDESVGETDGGGIVATYWRLVVVL